MDAECLYEDVNCDRLIYGDRMHVIMLAYSSATHKIHIFTFSSQKEYLQGYNISSRILIPAEFTCNCKQQITQF